MDGSAGVGTVAAASAAAEPAVAEYERVRVGVSGWYYVVIGDRWVGRPAGGFYARR